MDNPYVGEWQVESITQADRTTVVPATLNARATFSNDGRIRLHDSVNSISGRIDVVKGGFRIRDASTTLAYYSGDDPVRLLTTAALSAMARAGRVSASVVDNRLTVTTGEFRILFTRTA